jgi:hypothetical protein
LANGVFLLFSGAAVVAILAWAIRGRRPFFFGADAAAPAPAVLAFFLAAVTLTASFPDMIVIPRERQSWPVAASETLANGLYETGYTFSQVLAALQRQSPGTVENTIAILDPDFFGPPTPVVDAGWSLLALMVDPSVAARSEDVVLSFPISRSRSAIVVRAPSYLDRTRLRTCYSVACDREPDPGACTERQPALAPAHLPPFFHVDRQEKPVPGEGSSYPPGGWQYCIRFSMPIRTPGTGVPHLVRAIDQWPLQARITKVSGVDYEGELPGVEVRLTDQRESSGVLEVEVSSDGPGPGADWLADPPLIEVGLGNQHLLEPFRSTRMTRW